jgi:Na+-driven multidrug efflux pump
MAGMLKNEHELAAHTSVLNFGEIFFNISLGAASTIGFIIGNLAGAQKKKQLIYIIKLSLIMTGFLALAMNVVTFFVRSYSVDLFCIDE